MKNTLPPCHSIPWSCVHVEHVDILTLQICEEYEVTGMWSTRYKSTWMTNRRVCDYDSGV